MDGDALSHCRCFLRTPSQALTREQERKQTDQSLYFTETFETGSKMQRKYWLTTVAESLKAKGRENLRRKRVQRRLHEEQDRKKEWRMKERRLLWSLYPLFSHRASRSPLAVLALPWPVEASLQAPATPSSLDPIPARCSPKAGKPLGGDWLPLLKIRAVLKVAWLWIMSTQNQIGPLAYSWVTGVWNPAHPLCRSVQWHLMAHRLCPVTGLHNKPVT